jgi:hypothetical protein
MGGLRIGGAWDWSATNRDTAMLGDSSNVCTTPTATGESEWLTDVGWPTTSCVDGMVLQQS